MTGRERILAAFRGEPVERAPFAPNIYRLVESMGAKRHFNFASSCNTWPLTPWENLRYFRDAGRAYGHLN